MVLIFAQLPSVPAPRVSPWEGMRHEWVGWDGSVWDLATGSEGVRLLVEGVEGLHFPSLTKYRSTSRAVPGARLRGWRAAEREVFWPLSIHDTTSSAGFIDLANRFFRTIRPDLPGTWRVGAGGQFRELQLTGRFEESHSYPRDPVMDGAGLYKVTLEAAQPFWSGEAVERGPWLAPASSDFRPAGGTPMFFISSGSAFGSATMPNPGDVERYVEWTVDGALSSVELGVPGGIIDVPFSVPSGQRLVIDTDPRNVNALMGPIPDEGEPFVGTDMTVQLGFQSFRPVAPGSEVELHVDGTGTGSVSARLVPHYFRAY